MHAEICGEFINQEVSCVAKKSRVHDSTVSYIHEWKTLNKA